MSTGFINIVIVIGAVAAVIGTAVGIFNLIKMRYRLIISVIDRKDSYDDRGFTFVEFHITNMTNRYIVMRRFGLLYSDGSTIQRNVNYFLKPRESIVEPSGWQLFEDKERKRYIKHAFAEDTTGRIHKGKTPKAIKYYSQ